MFGLFHHWIPRENRLDDGVIKKKKSIGERKLDVVAQLARRSHIGKRRPTFVPPPRPSPYSPAHQRSTVFGIQPPTLYTVWMFVIREKRVWVRTTDDRCAGSVYFRVDDSAISYTIHTRFVKITPVVRCNSSALRAFGIRIGNFRFYKRYQEFNNYHRHDNFRDRLVPYVLFSANEKNGYFSRVIGDSNSAVEWARKTGQLSGATRFFIISKA